MKTHFRWEKTGFECNPPRPPFKNTIQPWWIFCCCSSTRADLFRRRNHFLYIYPRLRLCRFAAVVSAFQERSAVKSVQQQAKTFLTRTWQEPQRRGGAAARVPLLGLWLHFVFITYRSDRELLIALKYLNLTQYGTNSPFLFFEMETTASNYTRTRSLWRNDSIFLLDFKAIAILSFTPFWPFWENDFHT